MKKNRRDFIKFTGMGGIGLAGMSLIPACALGQVNKRKLNKITVDYAETKLEDGKVISTPFWRVDSGKESQAPMDR